MNKILNKFKIQQYNIGIVKKSIDKVMKNGIVSGDIIWLKHNYNDRFFADPFLIDEDEKYFYVLCEEYTFYERLGKISLIIADKEEFNLVSKRIVIEEDFHLSFPFCFFGEKTIIPESAKRKKMYEYILDDDYNIIKKTCISDEGSTDPVIYRDDSGKKHLYASDMSSANFYEFIKNKNGKYCKSNKAIYENDHKHARPAGQFFTYNNSLYLPVQDCEERYGRRVNIMEVSSVGSAGYSSKEVKIISGDANPPYNETFHTFNVYDNCILVDGSKDITKFPMKIIYKLLFELKYKKRIK